MNRLVACLAVIALTSACTTAQRVGFEKTVAQTLISDEQEFQLGFQVHEELKTQQTKFSEDPEIINYVNRLASKLKPQAEADRKLEWMWFVIDDPNTVNAFATPGGRIYVYTGLIKAAETEAEIIGVLGHEMGHVVARHGSRQLVGQLGLQTVAKMALGQDASDVAQVAASLAGKGALLAYGRGMELESDEIGARYSSRAGYDPNGLASFFEKLKAKGEQPAFLVFLSSHPPNDERISKVKELIAKEGLNGTEQGVASLRAIQARIR
jgi:beta-barrel assembly-enhancing protease